MNRWTRWAVAAARKLRGALGLSLIGGVVAAMAGSIFTATVMLLEYGMPFSRDLPGLFVRLMGEMAAVYFAVGAVTTAVFATVLAVTGRRLTLTELSVPRAALTGGVIGVVVPIVFIAGAAGLPYALGTIVEGLPVWVGFGAGGAAIAGGLVAAAKRAEQSELGAADETIARIEG